MIISDRSYVINWWISLDKSAWNCTFFLTLYYSRCKRNQRFSWCIFRTSIISYDGWFVKGINTVSQNRNSRVFLSLFFFFCFYVLVDPITSPSYFYREKYENNGRVQFSSVVQVSFGQVDVRNDSWRRELLMKQTAIGPETCASFWGPMPRSRQKNGRMGFLTALPTFLKWKKDHYNTRYACCQCIFLLLFRAISLSLSP